MRSRENHMHDDEQRSGLIRRDFLFNTAIAEAAFALAPVAWASAVDPIKNKTTFYKRSH